MNFNLIFEQWFSINYNIFSFFIAKTTNMSKISRFLRRPSKVYLNKVEYLKNDVMQQCTIQNFIQLAKEPNKPPSKRPCQK